LSSPDDTVRFENAQAQNINQYHYKLVRDVNELKDAKNDAREKPKKPSGGSRECHDERGQDGPKDG
jgi:hypothetical protein